jgi:predicted O-methyltransferase YrrM
VLGIPIERARPAVVTYVSRLRMLWALWRLRSSTDLGERRLRAAIRGVVFGRITAEERDWIEAIEVLRRRVLRSSANVEIDDYGAGSPATRPSAEMMQRGRLLRRSVDDICRTASVPPVWGLLLFKLVRTFKPRECIELGTSLGISTAYQAAALEVNGEGRLITLEGARGLAATARDNLCALGLEHRVTSVVGRFQDRLQPLLESEQKVDYAFVDGHHDEQATCQYFEQLVSAARTPAVLVFDDITWSPGMRRAWSVIVADSRTHFTLAVGQMGVCLAGGVPTTLPDRRV